MRCGCGHHHGTVPVGRIKTGTRCLSAGSKQGHGQKRRVTPDRKSSIVRAESGWKIRPIQRHRGVSGFSTCDLETTARFMGHVFNNKDYHIINTVFAQNKEKSCSYCVFACFTNEYKESLQGFEEIMSELHQNKRRN